VTTYEAAGLNDPKTVKSDLLVTSVVVKRLGGHDHVKVWSRGGRAGDLVVNAGVNDEDCCDMKPRQRWQVVRDWVEERIMESEV
jgi:hypothetical protein